MSKLSKSPERNTFQKNKFLERQAEKGLTIENDEDTRQMVEWYKSFDIREDERESDPEWQKDNLEWDLRTTDWIIEKARASESYAQNLYAAMCNNDFQRLEVMPILEDKTWSCSWRYAGGIVAHMRGEGDYIDWYCSGIRDVDSPDNGFVGESVVTDEIRADLKRLGWLVLDEQNTER